MSRFLTALLCVFLLGTGIALAQDEPRVEMFGGYQFLRADTGANVSSVNHFNLNGWNASMTGYFNRYFGITADFGGGYGTPEVLGVGISTKLHTFMFGPAIRFTNPSKVTPYVHALFGGPHISGSALGVSASSTDFSWAIGGGVDYKIGKAFAIRVAQGDYLQTRFSNDSQSNFRISTGVILRF